MRRSRLSAWMAVAASCQRECAHTFRQHTDSSHLFRSISSSSCVERQVFKSAFCRRFCCGLDPVQGCSALPSNTNLSDPTSNFNKDHAITRSWPAQADNSPLAPCPQRQPSRALIPSACGPTFCASLFAPASSSPSSSPFGSLE